MERGVMVNKGATESWVIEGSVAPSGKHGGKHDGVEISATGLVLEGRGKCLRGSRQGEKLED